MLSAIQYNPLLRKSEVFLNFAEASNEAWGPKVKGPDCQYSAYDVLKTIRHLSRGLPENDAYLEEMSASKEQFRKLVQNERRLELAFENQRWFDLLRWGKAIEVVNKHIQETEWDFYAGYTQQINKLQDYQLILPIPQSVIDNNPGVITQNPNY